MFYEEELINHIFALQEEMPLWYRNSEILDFLVEKNIYVLSSQIEIFRLNQAANNKFPNRDLLLAATKIFCRIIDPEDALIQVTEDHLACIEYALLQKKLRCTKHNPGHRLAIRRAG